MCVGENLLDVGENRVGVEGGVDGAVEVPLGVVVDQGKGLLVVRSQPFLERLWVVISPPDERFSGDLKNCKNYLSPNFEN